LANMLGISEEMSEALWGYQLEENNFGGAFKSCKGETPPKD